MREIEWSSFIFINAKSQLIIYSKMHLSSSMRTESQIMRLHEAQSICDSFFFFVLSGRREAAVVYFSYSGC